MTAEEYFDVVDESDVVIDRRTRREVHALGLRHRAVHVLVFNSNGDLFLQKRSLQKDCFPGAWDSSASGHLAPGEDYDDCAIRETREELGLVLTERPPRLFKIGACVQTGNEFVWVYRTFADGPFELHPEEIERGGWFAPSQIKAWTTERPADFASGFLLIWERFLRCR